MGILSIILLVIFVITALLLILVIALQSDDSSGLGGIFGGSSDSAFGGQTSRVLNKFTAIVAAVFLILAILIGVISKSSNNDSILKEVDVKVEKEELNTNWWK